ncbi:Glutathione S-transferase [Tranquillimonas rosea]|uniref:Glutathione S-transferase n=1 Tax=Tranquillimonas rosea TaxID=641238 RepID=A0A1H9ULD0_9RHOB|nr:glutathione S-transferase [Tranquillimonas rosea]SES10172.1 Glutathione S-transferase [Tranquillimonas rosea]
MQLFHSPGSPFVRKVVALVHEAGRVGDLALVPATVSPVTSGDATLAHNPLGKIPTLQRPDGPALYDSRVICRYLDAHWDAGLYPETRIWDVLTLEATADGIMDAAVLMTYEARFRPAEMRSQEWVDGQWGKIARSLDALETRWMSHLAGRLDMGQIALACALAYVDFRHGDRNWRAGHAPLAEWFAKIEARESMQATQPPAA